MNDPNRELRDLALTKMSAVLGAERAQELLQTLLAELRIELRTPQELHRFSEALGRFGGFEAAVGAMLGVSAVIRGASTVRSTTSEQARGRDA